MVFTINTTTASRILESLRIITGLRFWPIFETLHSFPIRSTQVDRWVGARSINRLKVSAALVRYYDAIDRPLTAANMHYTVDKFFILQWKAVQDMKNESDGVVPKLTRNTTCIKWVPIMLELLGTVIGVRDVPLIYVLREDELVAAAMALLTDKPFQKSIKEFQVQGRHQLHT